MKTYEFNMTISAEDDITQDEILDKLIEFAEQNGFFLGGGIKLSEKSKSIHDKINVKKNQ